MSITPHKLISVIVVCKNESDNIATCIDSLLNQQLTDMSAEILVIDGESEDNTVQIIKDKYAEQVVIITNPNKYTPHGINKGIKMAKGDYIAIVGARSTLCHDYLQQCVNLLKANPNIWCAGGRIIQQGTDLISNSIADAMSSTIGVGMLNFRTIQRNRKVDTVSCPVMPKTTIQRIGLFDETLIRNQDEDYSFRIIRAGGSVFQLANIYSTYHVRQQFSNLYRQYFQYGFWKILLNKKHKTITTLRQIFPAIFQLSIIALVVVMPILALVEILTYLLTVSIAAIYQSSNRKSHFSYIIRSIVTMHMAYGLGYWFGVWKILIKKTVPEELKTLTR